MGIGSYIKLVRTARGLTREDLLDVCDTKTLYRTEHNITSPSADLLIKIAKRLSIDPSSLINREVDDLINHQLVELDRMFHPNQTDEFINFYKFIKENFTALEDMSIYEKQLVLHYEARALFFGHKNLDGALAILEKSLAISLKKKGKKKIHHSILSIIELRSILLKSFLLMDSGNLKACKEFIEKFDMTETKFNNLEIDRVDIILKLNYNLALSKFKLNDFKGLAKMINDAIEVCNKYSLYDKSALFYWLNAKYCFEIGEIENCHLHCRLYLDIAKFQGKQKMVDLYIDRFKEDYDFIY
jgi:transcriptional regulator with XRE-family HTH domain